METGMDITLTQFIPPHEDSFLSEGICSMECLKLVSSIETFILSIILKTKHVISNYNKFN